MDEYKIVLKKAFEEVEQRELQITAQDSQVEWDYSPEFERKMNKLIRSQKHSYWKYVNTAGKRIAIIVALIAVSFSCAMAVEASRKVIIKFFENVFDTHTQIVSYVDQEDLDDIPQYIEKIYTIEQIPEGFEQTYYYEDKGQVLTEWKNSDNKCCFLHQLLVGSASMYDTEGTYMQESEINGYKVYNYTKNGYSTYIWEENDYIFCFCVPDKMGDDFIDSVVGNLIESNYFF